jgi:hypothetical protein
MVEGMSGILEGVVAATVATGDVENGANWRERDARREVEDTLEMIEFVRRLRSMDRYGGWLGTGDGRLQCRGTSTHNIKDPR